MTIDINIIDDPDMLLEINDPKPQSPLQEYRDGLDGGLEAGLIIGAMGGATLAVVLFAIGFYLAV